MLEWLTFKNSKNSKLKGLRKREGERERERGGSGRRVGGEQSDKGEIRGMKRASKFFAAQHSQLFPQNILRALDPSCLTLINLLCMGPGLDTILFKLNA